MMIEVRKLIKRFGLKSVLRGLDFHVECSHARKKPAHETCSGGSPAKGPIADFVGLTIYGKPLQHLPLGRLP